MKGLNCTGDKDGDRQERQKHKQNNRAPQAPVFFIAFPSLS